MEKGIYILVHNHAQQGLVLSQEVREQLLIGAEGKLIAIIESSIYSLQPEIFRHITRRPLTVILWGMEDRYNVAASQKVEILVANGYSDVSHYCNDLRPRKVSDTETIWERKA